MSRDSAHDPLCIRLMIIVALAGMLLLLASPSWAASVCYDEKFYPSVVGLEKTESGFRAFLGGKAFNEERGRPIERLVLKFTDKEGWQPDRSFPCRDGINCLPPKEPGGHGIPPITLSKKEAVALVPRLQEAEVIAQEVSAWTEHGGVIWFGIGFYAGEGTDGVGGIGRYDPRTKKTVIRRPKVLLGSSINHLVHDGKSLWLGTTGHYECIGEPPTHGLLRYEWNTDKIDTFEGKDDGPCGFVIHDLVLDQRSLWVATDLGLSRLDRRSKTWEHYVPDPTSSPPMKSTSCPALYTSLLRILPRTFDPRYDFIFYSQLFDPVKRFRSQFLAGYIKAMPPADWGCDELKFLAEGARDFQALQTTVLIHRPVGSPDFRCILDGYGSKEARDPAWRDLLLSSFEKPGMKGEYRDEVILRLLENFSGDSKVGETLAHRLKTVPNPWREAELLPSMLGEKSVPHLIEALDRFKELERHDHILRAIVKALMQATRLSISPNGVVTSVPTNAEPDQDRLSDKALPRVVAQWKQWWESHKVDYGVGPASPEFKQPTIGQAKLTDPRVTLSAPEVILPIGTTYTLTATVHDLGVPSAPPLSNFPLSFQVVTGAHQGIVGRYHGVTDADGTLSFRYDGTRPGTDKIAVWHEGDDVYMEEEHTEVTWGGPDLVVPFFSPPLLMSSGGKTFFVTDWTQNGGRFPASASITRYFLSATTPVDPAKAKVVGERTVPALGSGERSEVKQLRMTLPGNVPAGTYYLAACADAAGTVTETDEQNNCSFNELPGQTVIIQPLMPTRKSSE